MTYTNHPAIQLILSGPGDPIAKITFQSSHTTLPLSTIANLPQLLYCCLFITSSIFLCLVSKSPNDESEERRYGHVLLLTITFVFHGGKYYHSALGKFSVTMFCLSKDTTQWAAGRLAPTHPWCTNRLRAMEGGGGVCGRVY